MSTHPNFTGRWRLAAGESALQIPVPDAVAVVIDHRAAAFRLERSLTFGGHTDHFAIELMEGVNAPFTHGEATLHAELRWEESVLVFDTTIEAATQQARNIVRYQLTNDGQTLVAEESFRGETQRYDNRWVFVRD